jgi:predicted ATPase
LAQTLAHAVAEHFADGMVWIDLAPLADPALVPVSVARAPGLTPPVGGPVEEHLVAHLRPHQTLLLDNFKHLLSGVAPPVALLLAQYPALKALATQRTVKARVSS